MSKQATENTDPNSTKASRSWWKLLVGIVLGFFVLLIAIFVFVVNTETGTRFALSTVVKNLPEGTDVQFASVSGTLSDRMTFRGIEVQGEGYYFRARELQLDWHPWMLFSDRLEVESLSITRGRLALFDVESEQIEPDTEPTDSVPAPIPIILKKFALTDFQLLQSSTSPSPNVSDINFESPGDAWEVNERVKSLTFAATWRETTLRLQSLQLQRDDAQLQANGKAQLKAPWPFELTLDGAYAIDPDNRIALAGELSGSAEKIRSALEVNYQFPQQKPLSLRLDASANLEQSPVRFSGEATWEENRYRVDDKSSIISRDAALNFEGTPDNYQLSFNTKLVLPAQVITQQAQIAPTEKSEQQLTGQLELKAQGNTEQLRIETLKLEALDGRVLLDGMLNWKEAFSARLATQFHQLDLAIFWPEVPSRLDGAINMKLSTQDVLQFEANIKKVQGEWRGLPFLLEGQAKLDGDRISVSDIQLSQGMNRVRINGALEEGVQSKLTLHIQAKALQTLWPVLSGQLIGDVTLTGSMEEPVVAASLNAKQLEYEQFRIGSAQVNATGLKPMSLAGELDLNASQLWVDEQLIDRIKVTATGTAEDHRLNAYAETDQLTTELAVTGQWSNEEWQGKLSRHSLELKAGALRDSADPALRKWQLLQPVELFASANEQRASKACWRAGAQSLCVKGSHSSQRTFAQLWLDELGLATLNPFLPADLQLTGSLNGQWIVEMSEEQLTAEGFLTQKGVSVKYPISAERSYHTSVSQFRLESQLVENRLTSDLTLRLDDGTELTGDLTIEQATSDDPRLMASVKGKFVALDYLAALSPEIGAIEGQLVFNGQAQGSLKAPSVTGAVNLQNGKLAVPRLGIEMSEIALDLRDSGNAGIAGNSGWEFTATAISGALPVKEQSVTESDAKSAANTSLQVGQLKIDGKFQLLAQGSDAEAAKKATAKKATAAQPQPQPQPSWKLDTNVTGERFLLMRIPEIQARATPDIRITADDVNGLKITGEVLIPEATVMVEELPEQAVSVSDDVVVHTEEPVKEEAAMSYAMNLLVTLGDSVHFDGLGLISRIIGQLRLIKTPETSLAAHGSLTLVDGKYSVYGQTLTLDKGELIFTGPLSNPGLNIRATRKAIEDDVVAGIQIGGLLKNMRSEVFSEPPMSQAEALSYLLTGRGLGNANETDGKALQQAAVVLGLKQVTGITSEIANTLGIDELTIKSDGPTEDAALAAGKYLAPNLYVGYTYGLFNRVGAWVLRYQLTKALKLESEYGENQSIDLIYSIEYD